MVVACGDKRRDVVACVVLDRGDHPPKTAIEYHTDCEFADAYQRNNKRNGQKNLRCFPMCRAAVSLRHTLPFMYTPSQPSSKQCTPLFDPFPRTLPHTLRARDVTELNWTRAPVRSVRNSSHVAPPRSAPVPVPGPPCSLPRAHRGCVGCVVPIAPTPLHGQNPNAFSHTPRSRHPHGQAAKGGDRASCCSLS